MQLLRLSTLMPLLAITSVSAIPGSDVANDKPAYDETRNGLPSQSYTGNPDCADFGYDFGWKDEGCFTTDGYKDFKDLEVATTGGANECETENVGSVMILCEEAEEEEESSGNGNGNGIGRTSGQVRKLEETEYTYATITSGVDVVVIMKGGNGGTIYDNLQAGETYKLDIGEDQKAISHIEFCFSCPDVPAPEPAEEPVPEPQPEPTTEPKSFDPVDTCLDESMNGSDLNRDELEGMACYNLTAYPGDAFTHIFHEGSLCLSMTSSEVVDFDFETFNQGEEGFERGLYGINIWVGTDPADIPLNSDGTADMASFPYGDESERDVVSYSTSVKIDSAEACSGGKTSYPLYIAAHTTFGDRCVPPNGDFIDNTNEQTWARDVNNELFSDGETFTYFTVEISCDCVPETTTRTVDDEPDKTPASGSGDPHFKTWTGEKFDYHGECDLVLVDNPTFADGLGLWVHIRTTRVKYWSFIEKVAVQIGNDVLEFANDVDNFLINGAKVEKKKKHHETLLGGFVVRRDPKSISIRLNGDRYNRDAISKIDLHGRRNGFPAVIVDGGNTDVFKGSLGLLGDWKTGRKLARDGVTEVAVREDGDATAFALEWQVRDTEPRLFQDARFPQYPTTCTPPAKGPALRISDKMRKEAEKACAHWTEDKEDCIFDVLATRDVLVAEEGHIVHVE